MAYFPLSAGNQSFIPQNYTAFKVFGSGMASRVIITKATMEPETVKSNRKYKQHWNSETQTSVYEESDDE